MAALHKVKKYLFAVGLSLSDAKTRIVHISEGFDFLGFNFRRFYRQNEDIREFVYTPSRKRLDKFLAGLKECLRCYWNHDIKDLIRDLNRKIRGFCNYFKWSNTRLAFPYLSNRIWELTWDWARRRHPKRGRKWLAKHYWAVEGNSCWIFSYGGSRLIKPYEFAVQWWKWPKVRILASPYDEEYSKYWQSRKMRRTGKQWKGVQSDRSLLKGVDWI